MDAPAYKSAERPLDFAVIIGITLYQERKTERTLHALRDLSGLRQPQLGLQFGLSHQDDLEAVLASLTVGQDTDLVEQRRRQVLGLIDDDHGEGLQRHQRVEELVQQIPEFSARRALEAPRGEILGGGDAEVDEVGLLARTDDHVVLALEIAVRHSDRMHREHGGEQSREELVAVCERGIVLAQRRSRDVFECQRFASDQPVRARNAGDAAEACVDRVLAAQQVTPEHGQHSAVRPFDDDVAGRCR